MRILLVTDKFMPERGGSQIILGNYYAHLPDHQVTVVTRSAEGSREADAAYPHEIIRVPYSRIPKLRSPLLWWRMYRAALKVLRDQQFDQIHFGQPVETAPWGMRLAKRFRIPAVIHTFAEDVTCHLEHPLYTPMLRYALRHASQVTTISRYTQHHLAKLGVPLERIHLLYPGVQADRWQPTGREHQIRERLGLQGKRVFLTVSRLIPRKGQDTVLQAMPLVLREIPDAAYVIVGDGPERSRLEALARELGVADKTHFVGSIANDVTVDYYHASDVVVMPNREMPNGDVEGFGLVFLEANACGKPVIGGRSGGTADAIEEGASGFLVDPTSVTEVAERLILLLGRPELAQSIGTRGRTRVEQEFTWTQSGLTLQQIVALAAG